MNEATEVVALNPDQVFATAEELVGDTITVEGLCKHICSHGD